MTFEAPNYTQVPNAIFDQWMAILTPAEFKVIMCIARKTFGWNKTYDRIPLKQIELMTSLSRQGVVNSLDSLIEKGLITKIKSKTIKGDDDSNKYEINVNSVDRGSKVSIPPVVNSVDHGVVNSVDTQKKDLSKERLTKEDESAKASDVKKVFSKEVTELCEIMLSEMRKTKPDYKFSKAQAKSWCQQVEWMIDLDKRNPLTVVEVFRWGLNHNFWKPKFFKPNPPKYLRGQFDQLEMQMLTVAKPRTEAKTYANGWTPETEQQAEWARINTAFFKEQKQDSQGKMDHLFISNNFLNNKRDRTKDASIKVPPETFKLLVESVGGLVYNGV